MSRLIMAATAASAALLSAPAAGQYPDGYSYGNYGQYGGYDPYSNGGYGHYAPVIQPRADQLQFRIHAGVQHGLISRGEAAQLSRDLRNHVVLERRYSRNGLTRSEVRVLWQRLSHFQRALHRAERSGEYRRQYDPYGY